MSGQSTLPLAGITVVALEQAVALPLATRHLSDLGARVIKVERKGAGDFARHYDKAAYGLSSHFVWLNRGKESIELDLKDGDDAEFLHRIIAKSDIVAQNLAPGSVERLGLGAEELCSRRPSLIYCNVSGYGNTGPYGDEKAYDLLVQAEVGMLAITGTVEQPSKAGIPVADIAAGMYCLSGVLTALYARAVTGRGTTVQVSMLEALAEWMGYPFYYSLGIPEGPPRSGPHHATLAPYGPFPVGDGGSIFLAIQNDWEWNAFCEVVLSDRQLADDVRFNQAPARLKNREALECLIVDRFADLTTSQVRTLLEVAKIAKSFMRSPSDLFAHPQLNARQRWSTTETERGPLPALIHPVTFSSWGTKLGPVPALGSHTKALRDEFAQK